MARRMKMLGGVFVLRAIATPHMATDKAEPKMDPFVAGLEAFLAPVGARRNGSDLIEMSASFRHGNSVFKNSMMED